MTAAIDTAGNVTNLPRKRRGRKSITRAATLMDECREQLRKHMQGALPGIMDQVDDALFDLADKADSNQLQSTYFEAMRSVRLCRDEIESRFVTELDAAMARKCVAAPLPGGRNAPEIATVALSLMAQDDLEETVAVKNIAGKISNLCHEDLYALDRRVALLLGSPSLEGEDNPLGPHVLCSAARDAVNVIEASVEIHLLVLKLFDRHLSRAAEQFYPQINAWLMHEGVLPNVHTSAPIRARHSHGRQSGPAHRPDGAHRTGGGDRSGESWDAYHGDGSGGGSAGHRGNGAHEHAGPSAESGLLPSGIRAEQVLGVLEQIMRVGGDLGAGENAPGREHFIGNLTSMQRDGTLGSAGNVVRELRASGAAGDVSHTDGLMIDVVAMMFDFILEDENIDDAMRALIGRLQIPVLKVAILDKSFFARRSHPARSFINSLAEFGARVSSDDAEHQPTLARVQELVKRILNEFEDQLDVFSGALEELEAIVTEDEDAAKRNAWTSTKVAEERERLAHARRTAEDQVEERLEQSDAAEVVAVFLREHWRHLLGERLFRDSEQGESWRAGLQTMDQLLWSVTPKHDASDRERLLAMLPLLLECLKAGMHELGMMAESSSQFLQALSQLHIAALRGEELVCSTEPAVDENADDENADATPAATPSAERAYAAPAASTEEFESAPDAGARAYRMLQEAIEHANDLVWTTAAQRPQCQGMGATVVALKLDGNRLVCAHAGDSRLYRIRDGVPTQLSDDHTYRNEAVAKGLLSEEDAASIANNMITRAVGGDATIQVDVNVHDTASGDLFLCCSDGLSDMLDDAGIAEIALSTEDLQAMAGALIAAANEAGGRDNISVGIIRVDEALPESGVGESRDYGTFVSATVATDPGRRRAHNEDCIECELPLGVMVLADGMGGHNAGEVASAMTVNLILEAVREADGNDAAANESSSDSEFDFDSINAVFWDQQLSPVDNEALYEAVSDEVQSMVRSAGDNLDIFDLDADASADSGALDVDVIQDAARDPLLDRVLKLGCGTWVEFGAQDSKRVRARLSWIAPERARYLFTDRLGQKVSEATPYGLAVELRAGRIRVLDDVPLFDRAVSSLTRRLR